jgi:hypothetical protein
MSRGKNYVNNNQGVALQQPKDTVMRLCEYGVGCTREDCIYRHEEGGQSEEVCLPFLAGKCTFTHQGCRRRHPEKQEFDRLIAKYKRTRCRFADECRTEGCLYLHPKEMERFEPAYIEPHHVAFPPLNGAAAPAPKKDPLVNSAWKAVPASARSAPAMAQPWFPNAEHGAPYNNNNNSDNAYPVVGGDMEAHHEYYPQQHQPISFNVNAKEFVPGNSTTTA